jgi:hypothetical protein
MACAGDSAGGRDGDDADAGGSFSSTDGDAGMGDGGDASLPPVLGLCATRFVFVVWIEMKKARGGARIIYPRTFSPGW